MLLSNGLLASASWDKSVKLWSPTSGQLVRTLDGHTGHVSNLAELKKLGYLLSSSYDKRVKMWDPNNGKLIRTFLGHLDSVRSLVDLDFNNQFASSSDDKTIKFWDGNEIASTYGLCVKTLDGHLGYYLNIIYRSNFCFINLSYAENFLN